MQSFANGLINGFDLAILGMAFALTYMPLRILSVALGGFFVLAPLIAMQFQQWSGSWLIAVPAALITNTLLALLIERFSHRPLAQKGATESGHLIASLGTYLVIVQVITMIWGNEMRVLTSPSDIIWSYYDVRLTASQLITFASAAVVLTICYGWIWFTQLGLCLRALADSPTQLSLFGYDTDRIRLIASGLAGCLAGIGGLLAASSTGIDPQGGLHAFLLAVVAVIVGGGRTFLAPLIGGILVGILRSQVIWHWSAQWQDAVTFVLLVIILFARPQGLLVGKQRVEAENL